MGSARFARRRRIKEKWEATVEAVRDVEKRHALKAGLITTRRQHLRSSDAPIGLFLPSATLQYSARFIWSRRNLGTFKSCAQIFEALGPEITGKYPTDECKTAMVGQALSFQVTTAGTFLIPVHIGKDVAKDAFHGSVAQYYRGSLAGFGARYNSWLLSRSWECERVLLDAWSDALALIFGAFVDLWDWLRHPGCVIIIVIIIISRYVTICGPRLVPLLLAPPAARAVGARVQWLNDDILPQLCEAHGCRPGPRGNNLCGTIDVMTLCQVWEALRDNRVEVRR